MIRSILKTFPFLAFFMLVSCNEPMPKTKLYAAPGDLSGITGVSESPYFGALIEGERAFVYYGKDDSADVAYRGKGVSFLNFEMSYGPVLMDVTTQEEIDSFRVQPNPGKFEMTGQKQINISVKEPTKFIVTVFSKENGQQNLIISAEMPDWKKPKEDAKGVLYLKPGVHKFGEGWNPFTNGVHTLYLEGGAVVEATLNVTGAKTVNIIGRGIFTQAFAKNPTRKEGEQRAWMGSGMGISITDVKNVRVDGIAILNSPSCQLAINNADEVIMKNVKLCGFGEANNDGLHLFSRNVIAEDLFICSSNDRIVLNGVYDNQKELQQNEPLDNRLTSTIVENIQIRDAVLYGIKAGGDIMISRNANADIRSVFVEDMISLAETENGFVAALHDGEASIYDVIVVNSKVHHRNLLDVQILDNEKTSSKIRSMYLDDIIVESTKKNIGIQMAGASKERFITDVIFTNITATDGLITNIGEMNLEKNAFVKEIKVKVVERDE